MSEKFFFEWHDKFGKYGYTNNEKFWMALITGFTNFSCVPALVVLWKRQMNYQFFVGLFTMVTSFMYHFMDSVGWERFFLSELEWHKLDNIGSIICFVMLAVFLADLKDENLEMRINYAALFLVIILQEADPWNLNFTTMPILFFALLVVFMKRRLGSTTDWNV